MTLTAEQQSKNEEWWLRMGAISKQCIWKDHNETIKFVKKMGVFDTEPKVYLEPHTLKGYILLYENVGETFWLNRVICPYGFDRQKILTVIKKKTETKN